MALPMRLFFATVLAGTASLITGAVVPDLLPINPEIREQVVWGLILLAGALYLAAGYFFGTHHGWWKKRHRKQAPPSKQPPPHIAVGEVQDASFRRNRVQSDRSFLDIGKAGTIEASDNDFESEDSGDGEEKK